MSNLQSFDEGVTHDHDRHVRVSPATWRLWVRPATLRTFWSRPATGRVVEDCVAAVLPGAVIGHKAVVPRVLVVQHLRGGHVYAAVPDTKDTQRHLGRDDREEEPADDQGRACKPRLGSSWRSGGLRWGHRGGNCGVEECQTWTPEIRQPEPAIGRL